MTDTPAIAPDRRVAYRFIVAMGLVSLCADVTYEGARGLAGPFLQSLGATGVAVGAIAGGGEMVGYALRLATGALADRTRQYWLLTILGFAINLGAVPLLAFATDWRIAALLLIAERTGKAIRNPARDTMIAHAAQAVGQGKGFGLHDLMDQIGATGGPLLMAAILAWRNSYALAFGVLAIPAILAMLILFAAAREFPSPSGAETAPRMATRDLRRDYWIALVAMALVGAATVDFPLIGFHFEKAQTVPRDWIPVLYSLAMSVQGLSSFAMGRWFDRRGLVVLMTAVALAIPAAPLAFLGGLAGALIGTALWGVALGAQSSVMKAFIGATVAAERRAAAFGTFQASFGIAWFAGSAIAGWLYDLSPAAIAAFSVALHLAALTVLELIRRRRAA